MISIIYHSSITYCDLLSVTIIYDILGLTVPEIMCDAVNFQGRLVARSDPWQAGPAGEVSDALVPAGGGPSGPSGRSPAAMASSLLGLGGSRVLVG